MEDTMVKIMIVDDDPHITALLKRYLSAKNIESITINESSKAISTAHATDPDLFILDLMMPPPDGFELCRLLRAEPRFAQTPILIITAMDISNSKATSFGANDYIAKPFNLDEVVMKVNFLINHGVE
jgi:DNA-binding response OmpR family regulator